MTMSATEPRLAYGVSELAGLIGVSKKAVYDRVKSGEIRSGRLGKKILIPAEEVERLLDSESDQEGVA